MNIEDLDAKYEEEMVRLGTQLNSRLKKSKDKEKVQAWYRRSAESLREKYDLKYQKTIKGDLRRMSLRHRTNMLLHPVIEKLRLFWERFKK